ncbi:hypothetical protein [Reinekea sp.]|uniref:hypothetical protein n=1 Tax=Reinekea sp. TaxID=1970455 RepID=UPI003989C2CC
MNFNEQIERLYIRLDSMEYKGVDPSTINFDPKVLKIRLFISSLKINILSRVLNSILSRVIFYSGGLSVKIIRPKKRTFSKGIALVISGLSFRKNLELEKVDNLIKVLMDKKIDGMYLWAHDIPYGFPGGEKIYADTPNLVTSAFVANSIFDLYKKTEDEKWSGLFLKIVDDIELHIPFKNISSDQICFMYTPISNYHVHNANLLYSELLAKKYSITKEPYLLELITKSIAYTIGDFMRCRKYRYAGPPTENDTVDNYHTGFVLRSLAEIEIHLGRNLSFDLISIISDLKDFYFSTFVKKYIVRGSDNLIQSHSLAEMIIVYSMFKDELDVERRAEIETSISKTFNLLYSTKYGYFYNNVKQIVLFKLVDKTEMIRWSNSWMLYAMEYFMRSKDA